MNQTLTRSKARLSLGVAAPVVLMLSLAACGGGSSGGASTAVPSASATGAPGAGGGFGGQDFQKIQACLSAAGITLPTQSGMPSFSGGTRPSGMPSFSPGGTPPSGAPNGGGRGNSEFQKILSSDAAQAALKACGITMPTGRPSGAPSAS
ncbi:hypothetical protein ACIB24_01290 [Spongisporangium articulatum]|uniref:Secreted protein n=1 Tax=Spongisporangium articulatum TaxID=3362603 RepID=A0ABW8AJ86_9ACTN